MADKLIKSKDINSKRKSGVMKNNTEMLFKPIPNFSNRLEKNLSAKIETTSDQKIVKFIFKPLGSLQFKRIIFWKESFQLKHKSDTHRLFEQRTL